MIKKWFSLSSSKRFAVGFSISFAISFLWIIAICLETARCGKIAKELIPFWLTNLPTYGVMCTLFWSTATGILLGTIDKGVLGARRRLVKILFLLVMVVMSVSIGVEDKLQPRRMQVYELKQLCELAPVYQQIQEKVYVEDPECELLTKEEEAYRESLIATSVEEVIDKSNFTAWVEFAIQTYYALIIGVLLWYSIIVFAARRESQARTIQLSAVTILFTLWIPLRVYQKYIQSRYFSCDNFSSSIATAAFLTAGLFAILIVKKRKIDLDLVLKIVGFFIAVIAVLLGASKEGLDALADIVHQLRFSHFIALYVFGFASMVTLGNYLTNYKLYDHASVNPIDTSDFEPEKEEFVRRTTEIIKENIRDSGFDTNKLAGALGMSRSNFYSKFGDAFEESPAAYIKAVRLDMAAELFEKEIGPVGQIAYKVGFKNSRQLSTAFKERYGMSPREYIKFKKQERQGE